MAGSAGLAGGWSAAIGAFISLGLLIVLTGLWGGLARLISRIPPALAQAMLAGVLLPLCLQPVNSLIAQLLAVLPVIVVWLVLLRLAPKWAVPVAFVVGLVIMAIDPVLSGRDLEQVWPTMDVVAPQFSLAALVGIALPLYLVTMASQNVPGVAVMRAHGYEVPWRETMLATGVGTVLAAPAGGHAVNLAAISAALAAGPDAGPRRDRRWIAAVACGASYLVLAATATALTSLIAIAPPGLIEAVAGLALLGAFGGALRAALGDAGWQTPAVIAVLVAASGVTLLGIGAAFWALVAGLLVAGVLRLGRAGAASP
nr:benzoate/H(+) symporter BenE family transporter [Pseudoclavibacter soli]